MRFCTLTVIETIVGVLLQLVAFIAIFVAGVVVSVLIGGMAYACGVLVVEHFRARRKG